MVVENVIHIDASPDTVWNVTTDVARWPEWTPTVTNIQLVTPPPFGLGSVARIRQPAQPESEWTVTEFIAPRRFAWETRRTGLHMTGVHDVAPDAGGTRSTLQVHASGFLAVLFRPLLASAFRRAITAENAGLKRRCEQAVAHEPRP